MKNLFLVPFAAVVNSILSVRILWQMLLICPLEQVFLIGLRFVFKAIYTNPPSGSPAEMGKALSVCPLRAEDEEVLHFCHSQGSSRCSVSLHLPVSGITRYLAVLQNQQEVALYSIASLHMRW